MWRRDNKRITFDGLAHFLRRVFHSTHLGLATLSMVCERYACRHTPAFAALCLPTHNLVPRLVLCWDKLYGSGDAPHQRHERLTIVLETNDDPGTQARGCGSSFDTEFSFKTLTELRALSLRA